MGPQLLAAILVSLALIALLSANRGTTFRAATSTFPDEGSTSAANISINSIAVASVLQCAILCRFSETCTVFSLVVNRQVGMACYLGNAASQLPAGTQNYKIDCKSICYQESNSTLTASAPGNTIDQAKCGCPESDRLLLVACMPVIRHMSNPPAGNNRKGQMNASSTTGSSAKIDETTESFPIYNNPPAMLMPDIQPSDTSTTMPSTPISTSTFQSSTPKVTSSSKAITTSTPKTVTGSTLPFSTTTMAPITTQGTTISISPITITSKVPSSTTSPPVATSSTTLTTSTTPSTTTSPILSTTSTTTTKSTTLPYIGLPLMTCQGNKLRHTFYIYRVLATLTQAMVMCRMVGLTIFQPEDQAMANVMGQCAYNYTVPTHGPNATFMLGALRSVPTTIALPTGPTFRYLNGTAYSGLVFANSQAAAKTSCELLTFRNVNTPKTLAYDCSPTDDDYYFSCQDSTD